MNVRGLAAVIRAAARPGIVVPHLQVATIADLDWRRVHASGVRFIVCDKDNCLTKPHRDTLVPALQASWDECKRVFGSDNILIVSNSAGTRSDPQAVAAEAVSSHLGVPVLLHAAKKPAAACAREVVEYVYSRAQRMGEYGMPHVLLLGDRITTDIVLAHAISRLLVRDTPELAVGTGDKERRGAVAPSPLAVGPPAPSPRGAFAPMPLAVGPSTPTPHGAVALSPLAPCTGVLTTELFASEGPGSRVMRALEGWVLRRLVRAGVAPGGPWSMRDAPWPSAGPWTAWVHRVCARGEDSAGGSDAATPRPPRALLSFPTRVLHTIGRELAASVRHMQSLGAAVGRGARWGIKESAPGSIVRRGSRLAARSASTRGLCTTALRSQNTPHEQPVPRRRRAVADAVEAAQSAGSPAAGAAATSRRTTGTRVLGIPVRWLLALAALVALPVCFFIGVNLNEAVKIRRAGDLSKEGDAPDMVAFAPPSEVAAVEDEVADASRTAQEKKLQRCGSAATDANDSLELQYFHMDRECEDIDRKLARLEGRGGVAGMRSV
ncbi:phosphatidylglycerophosphatase [Malassezia sp. CBS 17886]|nr:phosphatidylglycerophosphatase [Malassezia sp. CBS 17886]